MLVGRVVAGLRGAKRRDLDRFGAGMDVDEPEPAPDDEGAAEERLHLLGPGVGGDVEVLGLDAEQEVAHGAADDERLEAGFVQAPRDLDRAARQLRPADRMVAGAVDPGLSVTVPSGQQAGKQAADHRTTRVARGHGAARVARPSGRTAATAG